MKTAELLLDYACAARCPFCYNPPLTPELLSRRLTLAEAGARLYRLRAEGHETAWFTGGEPTQRPDLPRLLRLARKLGYRRVQIGTNGWRAAEPRYARLLAQAGLDYARVSIHGATAATHDRILGAAGAFEKATASLRVLREAGVDVGVNLVLCRWNLGEAAAFARLAAREWRVPDLDILFPHERGMMAENAGALAISYAEAAAALAPAFAEFRRAGWGPAQVRLVNFPPCVLPPRLRPHAADWAGGHFEGHSLERAGGRGQDLRRMKTAQKRRGAGCADCRLAGECAGFEPEYAARRGEAEFVALREAA